MVPSSNVEDRGQWIEYQALVRDPFEDRDPIQDPFFLDLDRDRDPFIILDRGSDRDPQKKDRDPIQIKGSF